MVRRYALAALVLAVASSQGCRRGNDAPPLLLEAESKGPVVFPPESSWTDRAPLTPEDRRKKENEPIHLDWPTLDDARHFEISGQRVELRFSEDLVSEKTRAKAPALKITPTVRGRTVWAENGDVWFHADKPFDPDVTYTVELPELTAPSGKKLEGGFQATFKATPLVDVAGKTIHYIPKPGRARVVAILPGDNDEIGNSQELAIVYDQPIDLGLASRLVKVTDGADKPLAASLRHPDSDVFDGAKADRNLVVLAKLGWRPPGSSVKLEARPQWKDDDEPTTHEWKLAQPPAMTEVTCRDDCEVDGTAVHGTSTTSFAVHFNNTLGLRWGEAQKHVRISPPARNVYVGSYGDQIDIGGSFKASTTYEVRIAGLVDRFGASVPPVLVSFVTQPLPVSMTIGDRVMLLDEASTRRFVVTTRNVTKGELRFWPIAKGDAHAFAEALEKARGGGRPGEDPIVIPFVPAAGKDTFADTAVDLTKKLDPDRGYLADVRSVESAKGAETKNASDRPDAAVVHTGGPRSLGAHLHEAGDRAIVQVFRLGSGEPVAGAKVTIEKEEATTDASGSANVALHPGGVRVAKILENETALMLPFDEAASISSASLFPDLSSKHSEERSRTTSGALVVDRGIYRPGSRMFVKGIVRRNDGKGPHASAATKVRLRVVDPLDADVKDELLTTNDRGIVTSEVAFDTRGHTGRFRVRLELDDERHSLLANEEVRVADFETPRFKVDVEPGKEIAGKVTARVSAKYLFGEAMKGGQVSWVLKKRSLPVKATAFESSGLLFEHEASWWDGMGKQNEALRPITGEATLGADGTTNLEIAPGPLGDGPTELTLEADVSDSSNRHVAGHLRVIKDRVGRHAGLKLAETFSDVSKPLRVELGIVDENGNAIVGAKVAARLERLTWTRSATRSESGAVIEHWRDVPTNVAECEVTSAAQPVSCTLRIPAGGSYRVTARAFGRDHASSWFYAWGGSGADTSGVPSAGKKILLATDKSTYVAGETARILVRSPYPAATALLTIEQSGVVRHETRRITGPSATFDVPLAAVDAPWIHAAVTLLPIGAREADYRVGVVRLPVKADGARLTVKVASAKKSYEIREEAQIDIDVTRAGAPLANADVVLAVVDEGILRMTNFHAKDPLLSLRTGFPLSFRAADSRAWILSRREKAHVAGGGGGEGEDAIDTRKNFVETAAWLPNLVTDARGHVSTKVKLPDNLTEFRMMVVAIDDGNATGTAESSFVVTKPLLLEPVMPRFAQRGDRFEAAAMVHNTTDAQIAAKVTIAAQTKEVTIPAKDRVRVSVPMVAGRAGTRPMLFALEALGRAQDRVEVPLRVDEPGVEEHPQLSGVFGEKQEIHLAIPEDALFEEGSMLSLKTGSSLYPELGQRLTYLLDYPHGCVEQTTSSTLPIIAARTLLPWTGVATMEDRELRKRIEAGIARLASMSTSNGGLAYWPGGTEPNVYGSAYALRAILRAKEMGIARPGLAEGVVKFLSERLSYERDKNLRVSIAEVLALAGALNESHADSLWDSRDTLDASGLANAAIALASLPKQDDRVRDLLDRLEKEFDANGDLAKEHGSRDYHTWGSPDRDRAQTAIALVRLRPLSPLLRTLASRLSKKLDTYTTQATAWSLLALADYVGQRTPAGAVDVAIRLEGHIVDTTKTLGGANKEVHVPLRDLVGKKVTLVLTGDHRTPSAFAIEARYRRPFASAGSRAGKRAPSGVSIHRVYTDPTGKPVDLAAIKPGQLVRVAVRVEIPSRIADHRRSYLAIVDRIPAGLEPVDTELTTTAEVAEVGEEHPFFAGLRSSYRSASHVERRDDRVQIYFDRIYSGSGGVYATYLTRATTPGEFVVPPCHGELMYENDSDGYSDAARLIVK